MQEKQIFNQLNARKKCDSIKLILENNNSINLMQEKQQFNQPKTRKTIQST
jgi:hypothetical protein